MSISQLRMSKLRHKEVKKFAQSHGANEKQSWVLKQNNKESGKQIKMI